MMMNQSVSSVRCGVASKSWRYNDTFTDVVAVVRANEQNVTAKGEASHLLPVFFRADEDVNWYYWPIVDELIISLITSQCAGQIIDKQLFEAKMSTTLYLSRRSRSEWLKNKWLSS